MHADWVVLADEPGRDYRWLIVALSSTFDVLDQAIDELRIDRHLWGLVLFLRFLDISKIFQMLPSLDHRRPDPIAVLQQFDLASTLMAKRLLLLSFILAIADDFCEHDLFLSRHPAMRGFFDRRWGVPFSLLHRLFLILIYQVRERGTSYESILWHKQVYILWLLSREESGRAGQICHRPRIIDFETLPLRECFSGLRLPKKLLYEDCCFHSLEVRRITEHRSFDRLPVHTLAHRPINLLKLPRQWPRVE